MLLSLVVVQIPGLHLQKEDDLLPRPLFSQHDAKTTPPRPASGLAIFKRPNTWSGYSISVFTEGHFLAITSFIHGNVVEATTEKWRGFLNF
jgi:hypothetical protein